jgi:hypothetical protein
MSDSEASDSARAPGEGAAVLSDQRTSARAPAEGAAVLSDKRTSVAPQRLGTGLSMGSAVLHLDDRVTAPCAGFEGRFPGKVQSVNLRNKTVHVLFDDQDEDCAVNIAHVLHERGAVAVLPKSIAGGLTMRPPSKKLRLPGLRRKPQHYAILDVVKIHISPPDADDHYDNVAKRMVIHFTWLWQVSDTRLEQREPREGEVTLHDVVNTIPAPYNSMHVVALRQFCVQLARKPPLPAMQIVAMFGAYDPAEFQ